MIPNCNSIFFKMCTRLFYFFVVILFSFNLLIPMQRFTNMFGRKQKTLKTIVNEPQSTKISKNNNDIEKIEKDRKKFIEGTLLWYIYDLMKEKNMDTSVYQQTNQSIAYYVYEVDMAEAKKVIIELLKNPFAPVDNEMLHELQSIISSNYAETSSKYAEMVVPEVTAKQLNNFFDEKKKNFFQNTLNKNEKSIFTQLSKSGYYTLYNPVLHDPEKNLQISLVHKKPENDDDNKKDFFISKDDPERQRNEEYFFYKSHWRLYHQNIFSDTQLIISLFAKIIKSSNDASSLFDQTFIKRIENFFDEKDGMKKNIILPSDFTIMTVKMSHFMNSMRYLLSEVDSLDDVTLSDLKKTIDYTTTATANNYQNENFRKDQENFHKILSTQNIQYYLIQKINDNKSASEINNIYSDMISPFPIGEIIEDIKEKNPINTFITTYQKSMEKKIFFDKIMMTPEKNKKIQSVGEYEKNKIIKDAKNILMRFFLMKNYFSEFFPYIESFIETCGIKSLCNWDSPSTMNTYTTDPEKLKIFIDNKKFSPLKRLIILSWIISKISETYENFFDQQFSSPDPNTKTITLYQEKKDDNDSADLLQNNGVLAIAYDPSQKNSKKNNIEVYQETENQKNDQIINKILQEYEPLIFKADKKIMNKKLTANEIEWMTSCQWILLYEIYKIVVLDTGMNYKESTTNMLFPFAHKMTEWHAKSNRWRYLFENITYAPLSSQKSIFSKVIGKFTSLFSSFTNYMRSFLQSKNIQRLPKTVKSHIGKKISLIIEEIEKMNGGAENLKQKITKRLKKFINSSSTMLDKKSDFFILTEADITNILQNAYIIIIAMKDKIDKDTYAKLKEALYLFEVINIFYWNQNEGEYDLPELFFERFLQEQKGVLALVGEKTLNTAKKLFNIGKEKIFGENREKKNDDFIGEVTKNVTAKEIEKTIQGIPFLKNHNGIRNTIANFGGAAAQKTINFAQKHLSPETASNLTNKIIGYFDKKSDEYNQNVKKLQEENENLKTMMQNSK